MRQFTDSDFPDLALAAFFVLAHRQPRSATTTDELIKQAAKVAERIIAESVEAEKKLKRRKQKK